MSKDKNHKKGTKIDVERVDLEKMREATTETPGILPYGHERGGVSVKPEDQGKNKGRAVSAMHKQVDVQMRQLYEQMETLAKQAKSLQERATISERIYEAQIGFQPIIAKTYYLYERKDGTSALSLVGPDEWGRTSPFPVYLAKVTLLPDHTWEVVEKGDEA